MNPGATETAATDAAHLPAPAGVAQFGALRSHIQAGTGGSSPPVPEASAKGRIFVWDLPVRVFHWSLVGLVATAWWTGGSGEELHEIAGYLIASLIAFRLGWGLLGTRHARFSDFISTPRTVLRYMRNLATGKAERHLGHNPPGGMMILALLACLTTICVTGTMQMTAAFFGVSWVENLHIWASNGILALVPLHVLGVVVSSWLHRENLVAAMVTGEKAALAGELDQGARAREQTLLARIHASQGFVVLGLMLAGGLAYGLVATSGRELTMIAQPTATVIAQPATGPARVAPGVAVPALSEPELASPAIDTAALPIPERKPLTVVPQPSEKVELAHELAHWQLAALQRSLQSQQQTALLRPEEPSQIWLLGRGGRLYGNWSAERMPAEASLPASSPALVRSAAAITACASCHGWGYDGTADGRQTQAALSLRRQRGRNPDAIVRDLRPHLAAITSAAPGDEDLQHLALFLSKGQHEIGRYIARDGQALGDRRRGEGLYQSVCANCHGYGGRLIAPISAADAGDGGEGLGKLAQQQPAEVFHRIRNGHPGLPVAPMRAFPISDSTDLLAYLQSLSRR